MYRTLSQSLIEWKNSPGRQPMLLRGARQTGKSYLVEEFGQTQFDHIHTINFEKDKHFLNCFHTLNPKQIIQEIEILSNKTITPGSDLLFLDEIQECPNAIKALRYFYEEMPKLHLIGAGSLLEFALGEKDFSMPVGRVTYRYLYPLTFSEMLQALGQNKLFDYIKTISANDHIPCTIHQKLLEQLNIYFILGGMPRIINLFAQHEKLLLARQAQSDILNTYRDDFRKYASKSEQHYCERIFDKSFELITKHFKYVDIDPDLDYRILKKSIQLLFKANVLTPVYYAKANGLPISATHIEKKYKLLFLDVGLVQAASKISPELILKQNVMQLNQGAITEQFVGQHLLTCHPEYERTELFYWQRDTRNSQAEIDYVISVDNLIIPIEVKSGKTGRLKSLHAFMESHDSNLGIKVSTDEFNTKEKIWSVPLYLIEEIPRLIKSVYPS